MVNGLRQVTGSGAAPTGRVSALPRRAVLCVTVKMTWLVMMSATTYRVLPFILINTEPEVDKLFP